MLCRQTPRMRTICSLAEKFDTIADIGCDHAYMAINLAQSGKKVIASDISGGPLKKAEINVKRFGLNDKIELRLCNGLDGYEKNETDIIIIAGMGGNVISSILESDKNGKNIAKESKMLILQPMTSPEVLRRYLYENKFKIEKEHLVYEDRRIYTIMQVISGESQNFKEIDCYISEYIKENRNEKIYEEYIKRKKNEFEKIILGLKTSENLENKEERLEYFKNLLAEISKI